MNIAGGVLPHCGVSVTTPCARRAHCARSPSESHVDARSRDRGSTRMRGLQTRRTKRAGRRIPVHSARFLPLQQSREGAAKHHNMSDRETAILVEGSEARAYASLASAPSGEASREHGIQTCWHGGAAAVATRSVANSRNLTRIIAL